MPPSSVSPCPDHTYDGPTLFVAGGHSDYLRPSTAGVRHLFLNAEIAVIDNTGHWLHAEQPIAFLASSRRS
jgi:pimeloyl-ACP methyl ester carboxylesterase